MKPIHRDMMGMKIIMVRLVLAICSFCSPPRFIWLVFMLTYMDSSEVPTDTRGRRNRPTEPQFMPLDQKFSWGMLARLMPRNSTFMENSPAPASPRAAFTCSSTAGSAMAFSMAIWG